MAVLPFFHPLLFQIGFSQIMQNRASKRTTQHHILSIIQLCPGLGACVSFTHVWASRQMFSCSVHDVLTRKLPCACAFVSR
ncbi:hypothetical protein BC939DRAFT_467635 [Gamsiella multidivaricata]|uniref:uncharacterized protein n=1 Tax=Gamsiella multidivaricata TaxID=101098 RepID=UPI00221F639F|nr:uncharacterized protein BC939DRAFT_467635 [Gamsiella multidivaricata]KAI7816882.1 hypothetical protein BC939DRAFT_467635 [Gamsiella multidivaricata]